MARKKAKPAAADWKAIPPDVEWEKEVARLAILDPETARVARKLYMATPRLAPQQPAKTTFDDNPEQMVSPSIIAERFGLTPKQKDRLRHKLTVWRSPANCREWTEVPDRAPRQAQYLYRLGSIRHLIDAAKAG
jgi:hypothetical protein